MGHALKWMKSHYLGSNDKMAERTTNVYGYSAENSGKIF